MTTAKALGLAERLCLTLEEMAERDNVTHIVIHSAWKASRERAEATDAFEDMEIAALVQVAEERTCDSSVANIARDLIEQLCSALQESREREAEPAG